jgi:uncharacterized protein
MKYLVLFAVLAVVYAIWRSQRSLPPEKTPRPPAAGPRAAPQDMVTCAHCGLHVPQSEALRKGARSYCCPAHRDQDASA